MESLTNIEPKRVFYYFQQISKIPRGSGNTKEISDYLVNFAKEHGLRFLQDEYHNVVIFKEAAKGYENAPTVILQGHMDMVCEKRPGTEHDFEKDGIRLLVEEGYLRADGTTLGADDGIALAYALAILEDDAILHPALEVLFTVDEEIGLLGAKNFDAGVLKGRRLINLDSESERKIWVSCAGGICGCSSIPVRRIPSEGVCLQISISGLTGGHSGAEIDKNRANANKLMGRFLFELLEQTAFGLYQLEGGSKHNVITKEASAEILVEQEDCEAVQSFARAFEERIRKEYTGSDEGISIYVMQKGQTSAQVLHPTSREKVVFYLMNVPYGVEKMSGSIENLVETSSNPGIVKLYSDAFEAECSVRSSVESAKYALISKIGYLTCFLGGEFETEGDYPAWEYRRDSLLRERVSEVYRQLYQAEPEVVAIHAGLECGLFNEKLPGLDCVSLGPDMLDIHTPDEKLDLASAGRVYEFLLRILENLKD